MNRRHTFGSKLGFGMADVLGGGSFALISLLFLNFLVTVEGISPAIAGMIVLVGRIWDAFIDPLLGTISDRCKSRFGRRRIFLLIGVIPVIVTFSMLWYSFAIEGVFALTIYYIVMYSLFTISFSIVQVPYNALLPDMVDDYETRTGYSSMRIFVSNISATISVTVPPLLLGAETTRTASNFLIMGIVFGLFYGLPLIISFFTTWENPPKEQSENLSIKQTMIHMKNSVKNRAFRQYLGIFCFGQMATDFVTAMAVFWLTDIMGRADMLTLFSGISMLVGIALLPFNNWLAKKHGKHLPSLYGMPLRIIGLGIAFFLGAGNPLAVFFIICVLNGIGGGIAAFVPWTLLPDLPDSDEMITGERNAGVYAGISTFIRTSTSGVAIALAGVMLQLFGYVESAVGETVIQTESALLGVRTIFSIIPIILCVFVFFLALRYSLTKKNHINLAQAVAYKRETGQPTSNSELIKSCEAVTGYKFEDMWVGRVGKDSSQ